MGGISRKVSKFVGKLSLSPSGKHRKRPTHTQQQRQGQQQQQQQNPPPPGSQSPATAGGGGGGGSTKTLSTSTTSSSRRDVKESAGAAATSASTAQTNDAAAANKKNDAVEPKRKKEEGAPLKTPPPPSSSSRRMTTPHPQSTRILSPPSGGMVVLEKPPPISRATTEPTGSARLAMTSAQDDVVGESEGRKKKDTCRPPPPPGIGQMRSARLKAAAAASSSTSELIMDVGASILRQSTSNMAREAKVQYNLALAHVSTGEYERGRENLLRVLHATSHLNMTMETAAVHEKLCDVLFQMGDRSDEAMHHCDEALKLWRKEGLEGVEDDGGNGGVGDGEKEAQQVADASKGGGMSDADAVRVGEEERETNIARLLMKKGDIYLNDGNANDAMDYCYTEALGLAKKKNRHHRGGDNNDGGASGGVGGGGGDEFEIQVLRRICHIYKSRHEFDKLLKCLGDLLMLQKRCLGPKHDDVSVTLKRMGYIHNERGELDDALVCYNEALDIMCTSSQNHRKNENNVESASSSPSSVAFKLEDMEAVCDSIISIYQNQHRTKKVVETMEKQYEATKRGLGEFHDSSVVLCDRLARAHKTLGHDARAEELFTAELRARRQQRGASGRTMSTTSDHRGGPNNGGVSAITVGEEGDSKKRREELSRLFIALGEVQCSQRKHDKALRSYEDGLDLLLPRPEHNPRAAAAAASSGGDDDNNNHHKAITRRIQLYVHLKETSTTGAAGGGGGDGDGGWYDIPPDVVDMVRVTNDMGNLYFLRNSYKEALACYGASLDLGDMGDDDDGVTTYDPVEKIKTMHNTASVLQKMGAYDDALDTLNKVLEFGEEAFGTDEGSFADKSSTLEYIGNVHYARGAHADAIAFYEESMSLRKDSVDDPLDLVKTMWNVGMCLWKSKKFDDAIDYFQQILRIRTHALGRDHVDIATTMSMLGTIYARKKDLDKALMFYEQALQIRKSALGDGSEEVAATLFNIGLVRFELNDFDAAASILDDVVKKKKSRPGGKDSPQVAHMLIKVAKVHMARRDMAKAQDSIDEALRIYDHLGLPPVHEHVRSAKRTKASIERVMNDDGSIAFSEMSYMFR